MSYTLREFLDGGIVPKIRLLTSIKDFSAVPVDAVSVQELPVDGFIRPNELVLSTAIGCIDDEQAFLRLVEDVSRAGAAAMILAFRDASFTVPEGVIARANALGLALFTIPWEYRFAQISERVSREVSLKSAEAFRGLQAELFDLYFEAMPLSKAAGAIYANLAAPVMITDKAHEVRGFAGSEAPLDEREYLWTDIAINDNVSGFLGLCPAQRPLPADDELIKRYIAFPLSMWFNQERVEGLVTAKFKNDFVWNLASENYDSLDDMARQGERLHFDISKPYTCILMRAVPPESAAPAYAYSMEAAAASASIEEILDTEGRARRLSLMYADRSLEFILFIENRRDNAQRDVEEYADAAGKLLLGKYPSYRFYWGISEITYDTHDFSRLYNKAALALGYCMSSKNEKYSFTYKDTKEAQIVSAIADNSEIKAMAADLLSRIVENDRAGHAELMATLAEYIKNNYNTSLTARELHIHRQSLLYRLEKIEALTGMSLKSHRDMFLLEVCTRIFMDY